MKINKSKTHYRLNEEEAKIEVGEFDPIYAARNFNYQYFQRDLEFFNHLHYEVCLWFPASDDWSPFLVYEEL